MTPPWENSPPEQRFWAKVKKTDLCWIWQGATSAGYGHFSVKNKRGLAHRFAYELLVGPIPDGLQLDHLCRNRLCVNPDHLEPVTQAENCRRGKSTKLTPEKVRLIRASTGSNLDLARRFDISASVICRVRSGERWADVRDERTMAQ